MLVRVQKILADAGIASRRKCEELIAARKVFVNDKPIKLGDKADPENDRVRVGNLLVRVQKKVYFVVNKPKKYISSVDDEKGRKTVLDLTKTKYRVFPVGRLDRDAHGLMLLTNDGELANRVMHPRYGVEKTYVVTLRESLSAEKLAKLARGVHIEFRKVIPSKVIRRSEHCVEITVHEGRKHIIKRMFFKLGFFVVDLLRAKIANLELGDLPVGASRELSFDELNALRRHLNLL